MPERVAFPDQLLEKLWFYVNFDCNLACRYCVARSGPQATRPSLPLAVFRRLVDEASCTGFKQLVITGGEPLLNPQLPSMLHYAVAAMDTHLLTNATLVASDRCSFLSNLGGGRLSVQVSLDSADPDLHDRLRGRGSWRRAVDGISRLLRWGFTVSIRATLDGQSDADVEALQAFLLGIGIQPEHICMVPVAKGGRSTAGLDISPGDLIPEPVVAADGVYTHPLMIEPSMAVSRSILPLRPALEEVVCSLKMRGEPDGARRYR